MAKRVSQAGNARTTDRTSARRLGTELGTCGKRRRWTAEQKRQIVAEGHGAGCVGGDGGSQARHQQRAVLCLAATVAAGGALDGGADAVPNLAGVDAATSAPRLEPAVPAPPELDTPATAATPVPPVQPDDRIDVTLPDGVAGRLDEHCCAEHALTTDRTSVPNSPRAARADCGQADRSGETAPAGTRRVRMPLRRFRHGDRVTVPGGRQFQGSNCSSSWLLVRPETRRSSTSVSQASGSTPFNFAVLIRVKAIAQCSAAPSEPLNKAFFRATATPFMPRSTTLVSISSRPSSRNSTRPDQCRSA